VQGLDKVIAGNHVGLAITQDGKQLFARLDTGHIVQYELSKPGTVSAQHQLMGPMRGPCSMVVTGDTLLFWQDRQLASLNLLTKQVATLTADMQFVDAAMSWAWDAASRTVYCKTYGLERSITAVNTVTGHASPVWFGFGQDPGHTTLVAATGDNKLLLSTGQSGSGQLLLHDLQDQHAAPRAITQFLQSTAAQAACDSMGGQPAVFNSIHPACTTVDAQGNVWVFDKGVLQGTRDQGTGGFAFGAAPARSAAPSSLRRIQAGLVPPAHISSALHPEGLHSLAGITVASTNPNQLAQDMGRMLQEAWGADVQIKAAGGEVVRAHASILAARSEWFRALLERWHQAGGQQGSGGSGNSRGASSGTGTTIDATQFPAAVIRLVLSFLYTGSAHISDEHSAHPSTGAAPGPGAEAGTSAAAAAAAAAAYSSQQQVQQQASVSSPSGTPAAAADHEPMSPSAPHMLLVQLLEAGHYFGIEGLSAACMAAVQQHMGVGCVMPWLVRAHEAGDALAGLKAAALAYAAEHYAEVRERAPGAARLLAQHGDLALELLDARDRVHKAELAAATSPPGSNRKRKLD